MTLRKFANDSSSLRAVYDDKTGELCGLVGLVKDMTAEGFKFEGEHDREEWVCTTHNGGSSCDGFGVSALDAVMHARF